MPYPTLYPAQVNSTPTELSAAITATQLTIAVVNGAKLPSEPGPLCIGYDDDTETVLMTQRTGNTLNVIRGFEGAAKAWGAGTIVARRPTAYDHDSFVAWAKATRDAVENKILSLGTVTVPTSSWQKSGSTYVTTISNAKVPTDTATFGYIVHVAWNNDGAKAFPGRIDTETVAAGYRLILYADKAPETSITGDATITEVKL